MKRLLPNRAWKEAVKALAAVFVVFVVLDASIRLIYRVRDSLVDYVPLPYVEGADYGPTPPWQERRSLIERDEILVWRGQPNYHRKYVDLFTPVHTPADLIAMRHAFLPKLPAALKASTQWEIVTNSDGFRDDEFPREKPASVFRIVCLGDSWTFGANVGQDQAYPQRLGTRLRAEFPDARFEVLNLGVMGYASYNGKKLLETRALDLQPDLVVLAFAMNEWNMAGYRPPAPQPYSRLSAARRTVRSATNLLVSHWELYQLLRYSALKIRWQPKPLGERLKEISARSGWYETRNQEDEDPAWMKGTLDDYERYHREMIHVLRGRGIRVLLLYNEFWTESPLLTRLEAIARAEGVALVDSSSLIADATEMIQEQLEDRLGLAQRDDRAIASSSDAEVIFRVNLEGQRVAKAVYITGGHQTLREFTPNALAMYDDGSHGDQRAGDGVWSYSVRVPAQTMLDYVYTNSGAEGEWEGLDVPVLRRFRVPEGTAGRRVYVPIDTFGKMYMHADPWHTNAAGNDLIASALLEQLKHDEGVKAYLARIRN